VKRSSPPVRSAMVRAIWYPYRRSSASTDRIANSALPRFIFETIIIASTIGILHIGSRSVKGVEVQLYFPKEKLALRPSTRSGVGTVILRSAARRSSAHGGRHRPHARKPLQSGGSPRIHAGEERFSAPKKASCLTMRLSAGHFGASRSSRSILELGLKNPIWLC